MLMWRAIIRMGLLTKRKAIRRNNDAHQIEEIGSNQLVDKEKN